MAWVNPIIIRISAVYVLMFLLSVASLNAQRTVFSISEYNKENSLPEELVKDIVTDQNGIPYFATDNGLFALIHNEFHLVPVPEGKSSFIKSFSVLKDNSILVLSDDAIYKFVEGVEYNSLELFVDCSNGIDSPQYAMNIYEDSKNRIWIADHTNIFCYEDGELIKYAMEEKNKSQSYLRSYQFIELDHGQVIAISQKGWFYKFNEGMGYFEEMNDNPEFVVHSSFLYKSNEILLGTSKGLMNFKFSSEGNIVKKTILNPFIIASSIIPMGRNHFLIGTWFQGLVEINLNSHFKTYPVGGFPSFTVNNMHRDRFGCVWAATNSGVVHLEEEFFSSQLQNMTSDYVKDMVENGSSIYFLNGKNVNKINEDYSVEPYLKLETNNTTKLAMWDNLTLVGNAKGEVNYYKGNKLLYQFKLSDSEVMDIAMNSRHEAWIITDSELFKLDLIQYEQSSYLGRFDNLRVAKDVEYINNTDLVISGINSSNYLYFYNRESDRIRNISVEADFMNGNDFWTRDIEVDGDSLFIASSIGLIKYCDGNVERIDLNEFTENEVVAVIKDKKDNLWVNGSKGIYRKSGSDFSLFTEEEGLPTKTSYAGDLLVDNRGVMWVRSSNSLSYADVKRKPKKSPKPLIYGVLKEDRVLLSGKKYEVNKNTTILFDVGSLFYPQSKNKFEYSIKNRLTDEDVWLPLTSKNQILITGLKVGDYQLKLRTKHGGNYYWSEETFLSIGVNEVWYLRWFSLVFYVLFFLALMYLTYVTSKNRARTRMLNLRRMINEKTKDLKELNQELEMANKSKDKFISILAHDLRNPFNAIRSFSQMLVDHANEFSQEEKTELIEMIYKSSDDTYQLLENLLEWANVQKGNLKVKAESFNLRDLMQENQEIHQKLAAVKKIKIKGEFHDLFIDADKRMVETVVRNLISNAIKFSYPENSIILEIEEIGRWAVIKIKDHGVGMSSERLSQLFRIDAISSTSGTSEETGSGFGLMLAKEFVELNNGKIEVSSEIDKGTVFSVHLPLCK